VTFDDIEGPLKLARLGVKHHQVMLLLAFLDKKITTKQSI
jgi:hypothetical protein